MFTGLIDHCGIIQSITPTAKGRRLLIQCQFEDITLGESIAVNGVCLTAIQPTARCFSVEISPETLSVTSLGALLEGSAVNLERALRVGDRLGGHFVSGHVDALATVAKIDPQADFWSVHFRCAENTRLAYLVEKGSITLNGVSLTLNAVTSDGFTVMLIPHTLGSTNLSTMTVGTEVNVEYDMLAKLVVNATQRGVGI